MSIKIQPFDLSKYDEKKRGENHPLLPTNPFRMLVASTSGSGKTLLVTNLILGGEKEPYLYYDKIYIISPSLEQSIYRMMEDTFEEIDEERQKDLDQKIRKYNRTHKKKLDPDVKVEPILETFECIDDFDWTTVDKSKQNLIVLDDIMLTPKQKPFIEIFSRGRHKGGLSVIYISQSFYATPLLVRKNCSAYILFNPITQRDLTMLRHDIGSGIDKDTFINTIIDNTKERYSFVKIDRQAPKPELEYTAGFEKPLFTERFNT